MHERRRDVSARTLGESHSLAAEIAGLYSAVAAVVELIWTSPKELWSQMATLAVTFSMPEAPISTLQHRLSKGIEDFYYVLLFTDGSAYSGSKIWRDWLGMGFSVAIQSAPPGTARSDRVTVSASPPSKTPEVVLEGGDEHYLRKLAGILEQVDLLRPSLTGMEDDAIMDSLTAGSVGGELVSPVTNLLEEYGFRQEEIEEFRSMIRRGLLALLHRNIKQMVVEGS
jgi:hypothetical protein